MLESPNARMLESPNARMPESPNARMLRRLANEVYTITREMPRCSIAQMPDYRLLQPNSQEPTRGMRRPTRETSDAQTKVVRASETTATGIGRFGLKCGRSVRRIVMWTR